MRATIFPNPSRHSMQVAKVNVSPIRRTCSSHLLALLSGTRIMYAMAVPEILQVLTVAPMVARSKPR
jgi:hypothetical protein